MQLRLQNVKDIFLLIKEAADEWSNDNASRLAAALAYYTIFSIAPLLLIVIAVVGFFWGSQSSGVQNELLGQIEGLVGSDGAGVLKTMLDNSSKPGSGGIIATVLGVGALIFGATGVFVQLQSALNTIWEVKPKPGNSIKSFILSRVMSFGMILGVGFLLLVSLVVSAVIAAIGTGLSGVLNTLISFAVITSLFAMIFKVLPDVEIAWKDVMVGAVVTAVLFVIGKFGIGLYLGNSSAASTYGAAGSLVVLLLWVYYSGLILFFGAEVTEVYARKYGSQIRPSAHAEPLFDGAICDVKAKERKGVNAPENKEGQRAAPAGDEVRVVPTPAAVRPATRPRPRRAGALPLVLAFLAHRRERKRSGSR